MLQADPLAPGLRLGRYELIQRLAVGGMAEIYLARATGIEGFEKLVVLKRILPQFAANESFVSMFLDEARLSATLQHPNIAQVHDIGQYGDSYFFTMEYVRGEDVRTILKTAVKESKRVPLSHCVKIIADACAGLHAAHEKRGMDGKPLNIIHRDVSPSNVIVSYDGSVKLLDFGVAKAAERQTETRSGTLKGKVSYMSPEQCRGKQLDRRSDIFALGILLYELTLRRRLFKGESEFEIMTKIVKEDVPPPSKRFPKFPKQLELILMKALRRDREERYATAQEMQVDLEDFASRNRLQLSNVRLGKFMGEMFVDRMREIDSAITKRPSTEELEDDVGAGSASFPDVEIDTGDRANPTTVASGLAKRRAATESSAIVSASQVKTPDEADDGAVDIQMDDASKAEVAAAVQPVSIVVVKRSSWPLVVVAVAAVAAAGFVFLATQKGGADAKAVATQASAKQTASTPKATEPKSAAASDSEVTPSTTEPKPVEPSEPDVQVKNDVEPKPSVSVEPKADTEPKPAAVVTKPVVNTKPAATKKAQSKRKKRLRRYYKRRVKRVAKKSKPKRKKPQRTGKKRSWQLDSPLPPPR